mgnify:CR=1 FL=1
MKIALEQGKGKGKEEVESTTGNIQNTKKTKWDPKDWKKMLRKLKKYWDVETRAVAEEVFYDDGVQGVNMLQIEPEISPAMTAGE